MTRRRILIIGDQDDIREVAQVGLELVGDFEVLTATCGQNGVQRALAGEVATALRWS